MHKFSLFVLYFAPFFSGLPHERQMMVHLHFVNEITIEDRILNCNLLFWKEKKKIKKRFKLCTLFKEHINVWNFLASLLWLLQHQSDEKVDMSLIQQFFLTIVFITKGNLDSTSQHLCPKKSLPQAQLADSRYPTSICM